MGVIEVLYTLFHAYTPLIAFTVGLTSMEGLIFLAILSGAGHGNLLTIALFGLLGEFIHDTFMFFFWHKLIGKHLRKRVSLPKNKQHILRKIERLGRKNLLLALFFSKFIYGVRVAMLFYASHHLKNYKEYMKKDLPASIMGIIVLLSAGWLAGRGFTELIFLIAGVRKATIVVLVCALTFLIFKFFFSWCKNCTKKSKKGRKKN